MCYNVKKESGDNMIIKTFYASEYAKLDSDVRLGGGTDDTAAIQSILDLAKEYGGIHLIMDGAALISRLKLYSNTTIECMNKDCGFYQIDNTDNSMLTNYNWDNYEIKTRNITLIGGTYNQNCIHQAHDSSYDENICAADRINDHNGVFNLCIEFYGVEHLNVRDITIRDFRTFAFTVGCFKNVMIENVWFELEHHMNGNQDGFHFWGPGQYLTVKNCGGKVSDDIMNIGPDERDKKSSITDVLVDGLFLDDAEQAVRLLSRGTGRLDRVTIRNVTGQYRSYGFYIDPWFDDNSVGNFGNIFIENVDLKEHKHTYEYHPPVLFSIAGNIECLTLKNIRHHNAYDNRTLVEIGLPFYSTHPWNYKEYEMPVKQNIDTIIIDGLTVTEKEGEPEDTNYITIYDEVENFILRNVFVVKKQNSNGNLIWFDQKGKINNLIASEIHTDGLKKIVSDESKIKTKF